MLGATARCSNCVLAAASALRDQVCRKPAQYGEVETSVKEKRVGIGGVGVTE